MALEMQGHRVVAVADGAAALDAARRHRPAAALLDIGLPGMHGYELAGQLRALVGRKVRLVALTGYGGVAEARRALDAGFDRHLTKPVDAADLALALAT
jgi:CheY-like chemotaxis protein